MAGTRPRRRRSRRRQRTPRGARRMAWWEWAGLAALAVGAGMLVAAAPIIR
ncbi:hypothetical protein [Curtobacterium sp. ME12]|uniref:hypothetical protein n=1 Tax=Curtobacterium sp. ME12 TaxID=2744253 RepID=UPI0015F4A2E8|nr:hypothetical protein [Curtobacterium sp. ME12]